MALLVSVLGIGVPVRGQGVDARAAALTVIGEAYAKSYGLTWTRVDVAAPVTVAPDTTAAWAIRLKAALAVGYTRGVGAFEAVPLTGLKDLAKLEMSGRRTPEQVVEAVAQPGTVVTRTTWRFGAAPPVETYTVFSAAGEPLFDTLLSLPVIPGPLLDPKHF